MEMSQRKRKQGRPPPDPVIDLSQFDPVKAKRTTVVGQVRKGDGDNGSKPVTFTGHIFGDPERERCRAFRARFSGLAVANLDPLYVIPAELVAELRTFLPDWLTEAEVQFEKELACFCGPGRAGIVEDVRILCGPLDSPAVDASVSTAATEAGRDPKDINANVRIDPRAASTISSTAERRLAPLRDMRQAYLGWLFTNSEFIAERDAIRDRRSRLGLRVSFRTVWDSQPDEEFKSFCNKWQITSFESWDLPVPQGGNLTGIALPAGVAENLPIVTIQVPVTMGLPVRYPTLKIIRESQLSQSPPHLRSWVRQLDSPKASRFINVFRLHFYRDIVLKSRFGSRFHGNIERVDRVMAEFLGLSTEAVRKLRRLIPGKCRTPSPSA